ncbi:hypothetical protein NBH15_07210 [Parabacteroides sp. W1-Q-101]|uniref:hypothetical protein n=1 Tax=Parabacteroides TaxID=375288 RepID=UPI00202DDD6A|nr:MULTISPECIES: hypothetical protein [Parabacteroides]MCM0718066.1 hypothetical protein [Parabacteroides sp. W1-Q-101]
MKNECQKLFESEFRWLKGLNKGQRLYVAYFLLSFILLFAITESVGLMFAIVVNFANSARLLKRVPLDGLED